MVHLVPVPIFYSQWDFLRINTKYRVYFRIHLMRQVQIQFSVPRRIQLQLIAYDLLGRVTYCSSLRWSESGINRWNWQPEQIASGSYFITLKPNGEDQKQTIFPVIRCSYLK